MRILFADEARFGRINRPRPCWAPIGIRPDVASQLIREYIYLYGAVSLKDGTCVYLIMPRSDTACFQAFLNVLSRKFARQEYPLDSRRRPQPSPPRPRAPRQYLAALSAAILAGAQPEGNSLVGNPRKDLQELRAQIN